MSGSELSDLEELLIRVVADPSAFGHRIVEQLMERLGTPAGPGTTTVEAGVDDEVLAAMADRDILLAAALGACECWGARPDCPLCGGHGGPGWRTPDPQLYDEYVAPAVARRANRPDRHPLTPATEGMIDDYDMAGQ